MGDSKSMPEKQGWLSIGTVYQGPRGEYVSPEFPLLSFWKTDRDGKLTNLGRALSDVTDVGDVELTDVIYNYSSSKSEKTGQWFENNELVDARILNRGQDVTKDDGLLPHTKDTELPAKGGSS
jgi:hypothetical protein